MIGHNSLMVAYEDGHSVATVERTYAAWTRGAKPEDVELLKQAMAGRPTSYDSGRRHRRRYRHRPPESPKAATNESVWGGAVSTPDGMGRAARKRHWDHRAGDHNDACVVSVLRQQLLHVQVDRKVGEARFTP
jgi:hypothetical protein